MVTFDTAPLPDAQVMVVAQAHHASTSTKELVLGSKVPKRLLADATDAGTPSYAVRMGTSGFESGYGEVQLVQVAQNAAATAKKTVVLDSCLRTEQGVGRLSPLTDLKFYFRGSKQAIPTSYTPIYS